MLNQFNKGFYLCFLSSIRPSSNNALTVQIGRFLKINRVVHFFLGFQTIQLGIPNILLVLETSLKGLIKPREFASFMSADYFRVVSFSIPITIIYIKSLDTFPLYISVEKLQQNLKRCFVGEATKFAPELATVSLLKKSAGVWKRFRQRNSFPI